MELNKKSVLVLLAGLFAIAIISFAIAADDNADRRDGTEAKNMTYGQCVSGIVVTKNNCYDSVKSVRDACEETAKNQTDARAASTQCRNEYKSAKKQCKLDFKKSKRECIRTTKPGFLERVRYSIA